MTMRTGIGYDIHPLEQGRALVLGGVRIEHPRGLAGHSDGDVLTHAIIDALLGAAALGDIGHHFPSTDDRHRGANSLDLLRQAVKLLAAERYRLLNIDATVIAEAPQLAPHVDAMRNALAGALGIEHGAVSVKATTSDGLGALGRSEGIAALAIALVDST
jgi:2-C-methyl-D-erythritol 2,4-cyclodiphosphate synthase